MLGGGHKQLLDQVTGMFNNTSRVEDDIHYLIVLSRLPGKRSEEVTRRTAAALAGLHHKMRRGRMQPARFWPARVGEAFGELAGRDARLDAALAADGQFGLPEHSLFAARMSDDYKRRATRKIIATLGEDNPDDWTPDVVRLTSVLPPAERRGILHDLWDVPALRETVVVVLASAPHEQDRSLLVKTLRFGQPATIGAAVNALSRLDESAEPVEIASAVSALRQFSREPRYADVSRSLDRLLACWTGRPPLTEEQQPSSQRWERWLREKHPKLAAKLTASTVDLEDWKKRLAGIDWASGDSDRGEKTFQRLACARCHTGNSRLGPELDAVARRFSRDDLFTAILDPNRDVSPAYRMTQVETASGKIVAGQLLYESPESTLVQTGPDTTVRITGEEIVSIRKSPLSPMPTGLLREAGDEDLADLYAWLRTLGAGDASPARRRGS
jgi:putative heme-binding domain-containing protein